MIEGHRPSVTLSDRFLDCDTPPLWKVLDLFLLSPQMVAESSSLINADDTVRDDADAVTPRFMNF